MLESPMQKRKQNGGTETDATVVPSCQSPNLPKSTAFVPQAKTAVTPATTTATVPPKVNPAACDAPLEGFDEPEAEAAPAEADPEAVSLAPAPLTVKVDDALEVKLVTDAEVEEEAPEAAEAEVEAEEGNEGVVETPYCIPRACAFAMTAWQDVVEDVSSVLRQLVARTRGG
ncbi:hypothetical protein JCM10295v2_004427 [Rhodotorula toruloides]